MGPGLRWLIFGLTVLFLIQSAPASELTDFKAVDSTSYKFYLQQDWGRLISLGKAAIKAGWDYYYLRLRLGIAYYHQKAYRLAAAQFERALDFSSGDEIAREYLYYSYLFSGQHAEARFWGGKAGLRHRHWLDQVYLESGPILNNNFSRNSDADLDGAAGIYGETDMAGPAQYWYAGLSRSFSPAVFVTLGGGQVLVSKRKYIVWQDTVNRNDYRLRQNQLYLSGEVRLVRGLELTPALQLLHIAYNTIGYNNGITTADTSFTDYLGWLGASLEYPNFTLGLAVSYGRLSARVQKQAVLALIWYPRANLDLYFSAQATGHLDGDKRRLILMPAAGCKLFDPVWVEADFAWGDLTNYAERNGFVVYNTSDRIYDRWELTLISPLNSHLELSLRGQYLSREGCYLTYLSTTPGDYTLTDTHSYSLTLIGGLKWKF